MRNTEEFDFLLEDLPWWESAWQSLSTQIQAEKLPHAILLPVAEGFAPQVFMSAVAKKLHCKELAEDLYSYPCGKCENCRKIDNGYFPDLHHLHPLEDKKTIGVEQIRQLIESLNQTAHGDNYRVVFIQQAELMTVASSNAILKTLEEPGVKTLLVLQTEFSSKLSATLLSRCQKLSINKLAREELLVWLQKRSNKLEANGSLPSIEQLASALDAAEQQPMLALQFITHSRLMIREKMFQLLDNFNNSVTLIDDLEALQNDISVDVLFVWMGQYLTNWVRTALETNHHKNAQTNHLCVESLDNYQRLQKQMQAPNKPDKSLLFREFLIFWIAILNKLSHS